MAFPTQNYQAVTPYTLAMLDLSAELNQMREGAVYCLCVRQQPDAVFLCKRILASASLDARAVLVGLDQVDEIMAGVPETEGPGDLRAYKLRGPVRKAITALPKSLTRVLRPKKRLVLLLLPLDEVAVDEQGFLALAKNWRDWAEANACTVLFVGYGQQRVGLTGELRAMNPWISGAAALEEKRGGDYTYRVLHWRNALGVSEAKEVTLARTADGFKTVRGPAGTPVAVAMDRQVYLLERVVLEGAPISLAENWLLFDDRLQLQAAAAQVAGATVVFGLQGDADVEPLARIVHALRKKWGSSVKLVIREMGDRSLRGSDEQLLLRCGATMVVSRDMHLARVFGQLEALQGQLFTRELIDDPEPLLAFRRASKVVGIIEAGEFADYLNKVTDLRLGQEAPGVLVALVPASGLSVTQLLTQINVSRIGDAVCGLPDMLYIFLLGCSPGFVDIALERVFVLPVDEVIAEYQVYSHPQEIAEQGQRIERVAADWPAATGTADGNTLGDAGFAHQPAWQAQSIQDDGGLFKPVLETLEIQ